MLLLSKPNGMVAKNTGFCMFSWWAQKHWPFEPTKKTCTEPNKTKKQHNVCQQRSSLRYHLSGTFMAEAELLGLGWATMDCPMDPWFKNGFPQRFLVLVVWVNGKPVRKTSVENGLQTPYWEEADIYSSSCFFVRQKNKYIQ